MSRLLELGGEHLPGPDGGDGKGDEGRGHVQIVEGAGHGVLAADGRRAEVQLGVQSPQQGGEGLAPACGVLLELFKELLEGEVGPSIVCPGGHQLGKGGDHTVIGPPVGVRRHSLRVEAPGHNAGLVRLLPRQHRQKGGHHLGGGSLISAAEGHQHAATADGGIEPLRQPSAGGGRQTGGYGAEGGVFGILGDRGRGNGGRNRRPGVLHGAVGVQEVPAQVHDGPAPPAHHHPGGRRHHRHGVRFQILRLRGGDESVCV